MNIAEMDLFKQKLGFRKAEDSPVLGVSGGLAIIWDPRNALFTPIEKRQNWMCGRVNCYNNKLKFNLINVYGPTQNRDKALVWLEIETFFKNNPNEVSIIGGDFNAILKVSDKRGGSNKLSVVAIEFADWINRNSLMEIQTTDNTFTWNNRRKGFNNIAEKLDRFFIFGGLSNFNNTMEAEILPISGSDHYPIQLEILVEQGPKNCPFKFEQMWYKDENILLLEKCWKEEVVSGSKMFIVANKLKIIKRKLLEWNVEHFGNIFERKQLVETKLKAVNTEVLKSGMDEILFLREKTLLKDYEDILAKEEIYWRQKSRESWLKDGDRNTKFFHNNTKLKRCVNRISSIRNS
ncbi:uncharacterized protein LOC131857344 [Cryptomeria japonica]|uniref:uncharacterized protein LOC131857344 n=1 Tax=Cryptomeria japonica TaxID=3369 RepID=UPI0027DA879B|nr:uncharacterized protein LOC131857344 [Cryptomeria japonica]